MHQAAPNSPASFRIVLIALSVALGGFLMGFDASVVSGVNSFVQQEFNLTSLEVGWMVSSLTLTATLAMLASGPLCDRFGRQPMMKVAALLFLVSALMSAMAWDLTSLVVARMIGGLGVGMALIIAPLYIAEIAPAHLRGRLVSLNQLNIVVGISAAFFSNYLVLSASQGETGWVASLNLDETQWRWMLGIEALPAVLYLLALFGVPESPRWLLMQDREEEALQVFTKVTGDEQAAREGVASIHEAMQSAHVEKRGSFMDLLKARYKLVMGLGIAVAVLQQITGINAVFFYAPMIFEQAGLGQDAAFAQAIYVGLTNLVFTLVAIALIDRLGRKQLLVGGVAGIALCMGVLSHAFQQAQYVVTDEVLAVVSDEQQRTELAVLSGTRYQSDLELKQTLADVLGDEQAQALQNDVLKASIEVNQTQVLVGILGFVACFAASLGPVMWVLFSELFPNAIRGVAISFVGLVNSGVSFSVQLLFPLELEVLGVAWTFAWYGIFAALGLFVIVRYLPETKGKSLEELEARLTSS